MSVPQSGNTVHFAPSILTGPDYEANAVETEQTISGDVVVGVLEALYAEGNGEVRKNLRSLLPDYAGTFNHVEWEMAREQQVLEKYTDVVAKAI